MRRFGLCIVIYIFLPSMATAQTPDSDAVSGNEPSQAAACFHPRPFPKCRSFWITEFGLLHFATSPPGSELDPRGSLLTWELGRMFNHGSDQAFGGGFFLAANDNQFRFGPRVRYRRWLAPGAPLDLAPGLILL